MSMNWKGLLTGFLGQEKPGNASAPERKSSDKVFYQPGDEEALVDEVPYKLEPDRVSVEEYLGRIRREGL